MLKKNIFNYGILTALLINIVVHCRLNLTVNSLYNQIDSKEAMLRHIDSIIWALNKKSRHLIGLIAKPKLGTEYYIPSGLSKQKIATDTQDRAHETSAIRKQVLDSIVNKGRVLIPKEAAPNIQHTPTPVDTPQFISQTQDLNVYTFTATEIPPKRINKMLFYRNVTLTINVLQQQVQNANLTFFHFNSRTRLQTKIYFRLQEQHFENDQVEVRFHQVIRSGDFEEDYNRHDAINAVFKGVIDSVTIHGVLSWMELSENGKTNIPISVNLDLLLMDR